MVHRSRESDKPDTKGLAPRWMKMRSAVFLRQPRTPELVQGPTSPTASTSRGVRHIPRTPELVRYFLSRRRAGLPAPLGMKIGGARSETGPSGGWLFSKQEAASRLRQARCSGQPPLPRPRARVGLLPARRSADPPGRRQLARPRSMRVADPNASQGYSLNEQELRPDVVEIGSGSTECRPYQTTERR